MPNLADSPSLTARLEDAVSGLLLVDPVLVGITVKTGIEDGDIETPYIVINASRSGERIYNSGVIDCSVRIHLKTTMGNGPKATDDEGLLALDAGLESVLFSVSPVALAAQITSGADYLQCYAVTNLASEATTFDSTRREIAYTFNALCIGLPQPPP